MALDQKIIEEFERIVGKDNVSTSPAVLYTYGFDASIYHNDPEVVIQPTSTEQVSEIMKIAYANGIPVVPRGAGTGLCGAAVPIEGGICLAMQKMNRILEISVKDLWVDVEAGVVYNDLNAELAKHGFFFPPSPGSAEACQVGGMVATNASGMRAVKYGATRDYVLGLTFVRANGDIVRCGTRTIKDASGYQLARLMCGSEGTLGVITEITFKLTTKPKKSASALIAFNSVVDAGKCISAIIAKPLIPASCELMDSTSIEAVNKARGNPLPDANALIIVEVDGETDEIIQRDLKIVEEVAKEQNATTVTPSLDPKVIAKWNDARKSVLVRIPRGRHGCADIQGPRGRGKVPGDHQEVQRHRRGLWPRIRWQPAYQDAAEGRRQGRVGQRHSRRRRDLQGVRGTGRDRHRRARGRHIQGTQLPGGEEDRARLHPCDQAGHGSQEHPESREGRPVARIPPQEPKVPLQGVHVKTTGRHALSLSPSPDRSRGRFF